MPSPAWIACPSPLPVGSSPGAGKGGDAWRAPFLSSHKFPEVDFRNTPSPGGEDLRHRGTDQRSMVALHAFEAPPRP